MDRSSCLPSSTNAPARLWVLASILFVSAASGAGAQQPSPPPAAAPVQETSNEELLKEIRALRREVAETRALRQEVAEARKLKEQVGQLKQELTGMRRASLRTQVPATGGTEPPQMPAIPGTQPGGGGELMRTRPGATMGESGAPDIGTMLGGGPGGGAYEANQPTTELSRSRSGAALPHAPGPTSDVFPLRGDYRYNFGTGALGGGGYFHLGDPDGEFVFNVTNQITVDGTFFDRQYMPTNEQGFNVPFARTFLYGNITKDWLFQVGAQGFLGQFNLLDMWMAYRFGDWMTVRFGKGLAPPLYEYYAFSPALEPVITNSPLYQLAGKRPLGVMFLGSLFSDRVQYWSGVTNAGTSFFYALNRNMQYDGAFTLTPFKGTDNPLLEGMGAGIGLSVGDSQYKLAQQGISFVNGAGEPTTNAAWVTSSGVPFATYNSNVAANGLQTRWSPHFFWYGRFSVLAEMINNSRMLTDGTTTARSTQWGYYVNLSYWLTGERDYAGNGFQGYSTVVPNNPFSPARHKYGIGAWQVAAQFSELNIGRGDFENGFLNPTLSANRLDQLMVGLNCWPNKYTRLSFDWVYTHFNNEIPVNGPNPISVFQTFWIRAAMFF
jgi:phosphate-selective porin OprO and OprP